MPDGATLVHDQGNKIVDHYLANKKWAVVSDHCACAGFQSAGETTKPKICEYRYLSFSDLSPAAEVTLWTDDCVGIHTAHEIRTSVVCAIKRDNDHRVN